MKKLLVLVFVCAFVVTNSFAEFWNDTIKGQYD